MRIFATRVWGVGFERVPIATFGVRGHRDRLLELAGESDRLLFVGTKTERTALELRGRLLAMAEIGAEPLETADFIDLADLDRRDIGANGSYKFRNAVALTKLWRFVPRPSVRECLAKQLTMLATPGVEELESDDVRRVLACPVEPVTLPNLSAAIRTQGTNKPLAPTTGPRPQDAHFEVTRQLKGPTFTYALRFGKHDLFKVGLSENVDVRINTINKHIPFEVIGEKWTVHLTKKWGAAGQAFDMEQELFRKLATKRTGFERVSCSTRELLAAWNAASKRVSSKS